MDSMDRQSVITSLKALRLELEDCQVDLMAEMPEAALMLYDVCASLGLSEAETAEVLGQQVAQEIEAWSRSRPWWPAESWPARLKAWWLGLLARLRGSQVVIGRRTRADLVTLWPADE